MIDESFIAEIPEDLVEGAIYIINAYYEFFENNNPTVLTSFFNYLEFYSLMRSFLKRHNHPFEDVAFTDIESENILIITKTFNVLSNEFHRKNTLNLIEKTNARFDVLFRNTFTYEFTDGDLNRIQTLINELRDIVINSETFTAEHQQRVLRKLEKLQTELHKRVSNLDKFWGLVGDAGVAIGKFGTDAKPFVDRIRELADIVWRTQSKAEELPSGFKTPLLTEYNNPE